MASEQENRIVAEVMDNMKMAETEESAARRYVRRAVDKILIYCCREDLPERLEGTAAALLSGTHSSGKMDLQVNRVLSVRKVLNPESPPGRAVFHPLFLTARYHLNKIFHVVP